MTVTAGQSRKSISERLKWVKVSACMHHDGFHHLGSFDEAPGTVQGPEVRADAQYGKITWLEELASERNIIQA